MGVEQTGDLIWYEKSCGNMKDYIKKKIVVIEQEIWFAKRKYWAFDEHELWYETKLIAISCVLGANSNQQTNGRTN